jgi:subtilisin family serine protease
MRRHIAPLLFAAILLAPATTQAAGPDRSPAGAIVGTPGVDRPGRDGSGRLSAAGRYIVMTRPGASVIAVRDRHTRRDALKADQTFRKAIHGFAGKLTSDQVKALKADPDVAAVVPDEVIEMTQLIPTGVSRVGGLVAPLANINEVDERVDADVAVVDTGIDPDHRDLNVVGGYNCTTSSRTNWRDWNNHGTHVAGTIGAIDNGAGVVGVAPGVRLWSVRILNYEGYGYLSWYVCGLDWIAAQRDPIDPSRPLIEAVNMSVTKWGRDDTHCGTRNDDVLHQAVCRVTAAGITVVAAAANDSGSAAKRVPASYNEVITVSALADTDGKPGGDGGHRCWSWGSYDVDDTFANFSNYGYDVDLIAPGKCIWSTLPGNRYGYMSGTSMATPHVTAAAALYKATRPWATPSQVKAGLQAAGNLNWRTSTDPDGTHEKLLDISRLSTFGDFSFDLPATRGFGEAGGLAKLTVRIDRTSTHFEPVTFSTRRPSGWSATFSPSTVAGFSTRTATMSVRIPSGTANGRYPVTIVASDGFHRYETGVEVEVRKDYPTASGPTVTIFLGGSLGLSRTTAPVRLRWPAATDPTSAIGRYQTQVSIDGGGYGSTTSLPATTTTVQSVPIGHTFRFRLRAMDIAGNWSSWVSGPSGVVGALDDRSSALKYGRLWSRTTSSYAYHGTLTYTTRSGQTVTASVQGRHIAVVTRVARTRGWLKIYVNGVYRATVSLYSRGTISRRVVWATTYTTVGTRTIKLVTVRSSSRPRVELDAILSGR